MLLDTALSGFRAAPVFQTANALNPNRAVRRCLRGKWGGKPVRLGI
jgi:hypothetical protein